MNTPGRVYVQMRMNVPGKGLVHVKGCNLIFEKATPQEIRDLIVDAASRHYQRHDRPRPQKEHTP